MKVRPKSCALSSDWSPYIKGNVTAHSQREDFMKVHKDMIIN